MELTLAGRNDGQRGPGGFTTREMTYRDNAMECTSCMRLRFG
jgi:hypothetical protein